METVSAREGRANNFNDSYFPLLIVWENYNNISSAKTCLHCLWLRCRLITKLGRKNYTYKPKISCKPHKSLVFVKDLKRLEEDKRAVYEKMHNICESSLHCCTFDLSHLFFSIQAVKGEIASACAANAAVNIVYAVHDPQHKQVNAGRIKCLWLCFRHLQHPIHWGPLSTGKRTWLSLDIPVLRKPHLIRSRWVWGDRHSGKKLWKISLSTDCQA